MTSPDTATSNARPHFGPRLAARVSSRARAGRQITQRPTIGVVARSSLGFGLAIGMSQGSRPLVTPDTSTSTRLRPPVPIWRRHSDEASAPTPTPSWAEQITRTAAPARTSAGPSGRRQSPTAKPPSQADFVSTGDRKLDALRRLLRSGPSTDSNDPAPPSRTAPSPAPSATDSVQRAPAAQAAAPAARPVGRRGDTWSGPRTAPGEAGRSFQPEVATIADTNAVLPEATSEPRDRKPSGGSPRSSDRSTDAFQRMLQSRGLISSSAPDSPAASGGTAPSTRPNRAPAPPSDTTARRSATATEGPVRRSPDRSAATPTTHTPRQAPSARTVDPLRPARRSNESPVGDTGSAASTNSEPVIRRSAADPSAASSGFEAGTTAQPADEGQLLTADRASQHDLTRSPTAFIRRSNLAAAARALNTTGPIEQRSATAAEFDTPATNLASVAAVAPPASADAGMLRSAAAVPAVPAERPIAATRTGRLAATPGRALDQLAQRNGLQHTQSDLRRPATSLVRALAGFQPANTDQAPVRRSTGAIPTTRFVPAGKPIENKRSVLGADAEPDRISPARPAYETDPRPLGALTDARGSDVDSTGAAVRPPAARQPLSVGRAEPAPRQGVDPSSSTVRPTTAGADPVQRSPRRQPSVTDRHDPGRPPQITDLPSSGRTGDRSDSTSAATESRHAAQPSSRRSDGPVDRRTSVRRSQDPRQQAARGTRRANLPSSLSSRPSPEPDAGLIDGVRVSAPGAVAAGSIVRSLDPATPTVSRSPHDHAPDSLGDRRSDPPIQLKRPGRLGRLGHFGAETPADTGLRRHSVVRPGPGALQRALDTGDHRPAVAGQVEARVRPSTANGRASAQTTANTAADTGQRSSTGGLPSPVRPAANPSGAPRIDTIDRPPSAPTEGGPAIRRTPAGDITDTVAPPAASLGDRFLHELTRRPATRPKPLPEQYRPIAETITGHHRVMMSSDHASRRALRSIGKVAATTDNVIHLDRPLTPGPRGAEVLAHELTHVAHPSPAPRFFDDDVRSPEERQAEQVAKVMARAPLAPSGAVSRSRNQRPAASGTSADVVRRSPAADTGRPGTLNAAALAAQFTSRSADTTIRRSPATSSPSSPPTVQREPDTFTDNTLAPSPSTESHLGSQSDPQSRDRAAEEFRQQLDDHFDYLLRHLERRMIIELERRGGRFWRGV